MDQIQFTPAGNWTANMLASITVPSMTRCIFLCWDMFGMACKDSIPYSLRVHARRGRMHSYSVRTCWAAMLRPTARSLSSSRTCLGSKSRSLAKQILVFGVFQRPTPWWRRTLLKFTNRRWEDTWKYYIFCAGRNPRASLRWAAMCRNSEEFGHQTTSCHGSWKEMVRLVSGW